MYLTLSENSYRDNGTINIYVVTHKDFNLSKLDLDKCYKVIAVGNEKIKQTLGYLRDDCKDNIAEKNKNYCELTAQYWYWKNDKSADIVGLCHYRRYFTKYLISKNSKGILRANDIKKILSKYDVIVPQKVYSYRGAYKAYLDCGYEKDLNILEDVIRQNFPEYLADYNRYFKFCACNYPANMYISSKSISDKYSQWLFQVLTEVEKKVDITEYSMQEARIFGYISERLLGVWLHYNNYKIKEMRIINTEEKIGINGYFVELLKTFKVYQGIKKTIYQLRKGN